MERGRREGTAARTQKMAWFNPVRIRQEAARGALSHPHASGRPAGAQLYGWAPVTFWKLAPQFFHCLVLLPRESRP